MNKFSFVEAKFEETRKLDQWRELKTVTPCSDIEIIVDGRTITNFSSNDYLGLSKHPALKRGAIKYLEQYGAGSTASRLICGTFNCITEVESKIAKLKDTEAALIFNSGYQANVSVIPTLADKNSIIFSDTLNHTSIVQGARLAKCRIERFRHNDLTHLEEILEKHVHSDFSRKLILTESVFSVDGDTSDIDGLVKIAEKYEAILMIDEAHATGVLGKNGMGLTHGKNVDVVMGTFGKGLGSFGAYIACSEKLKAFLVNYCPGFIYTTALPPQVIGAIDAALDLVPKMVRERRDLLEKSEYFRTGLNKLGYNTGQSSTQIVPAIIGSEADTMALSIFLKKNNILATGLRPPTVEPGKSRLRFAISNSHSIKHLDKLTGLMKSWKIINSK